MDYFIVVFLQCCSLYSVISASNITVGPQDTDAFVGGNVTFYCTVQNLGGNTVVWRDFNTLLKYSENRTIVAPSELKPSRYKITGNDTKGTFNLEITGIILSLDANEKYECTVPGASKEAQLQVYEMPPSPTCSVPRRDNAFVEGEYVDFDCTFESLLPKVEMNLTRNGNNLSSKIVDPDRSPPRSFLSTRFNATSNDNGALLRCSVDHQILSMPYYCSLTLNVMYKPIVQITQFGMIADGNASFTCDAVSNPNVTQSKWSVCPGDTDDDCYTSGNGTLTVEPEDSEGLISECEVFGSNVSCYIFRNGENELPVYLVILINDNFTIPNNMTVDTDCLLKCSVRNSIGETSVEYTIDNSICVRAIEPTTIMPTTPMPPTTTAAPPTTAALLTTPIVSDKTGNNGTMYTIMTTVTSLIKKEDDNEDDIKRYYYIIGGLAGGTLILFMFTIIILICRRPKLVPDVDSVTATQWTHYSNNAYEDSGGGGGGGLSDRKESIIYTPDNPFKTFGKEDKTPSDKPPESMPEKVDTGDAHDRDTLPMPDDSRHKPEKDVELDAAKGSRDTYLSVISEPQDTAASQPDESSGHDEPPPDVLESVDGVQYTDFTDQPQSDLSTFKGTEGNTSSPSITQI